MLASTLEAMSQPASPTQKVLAVNAVDLTKTYGSLIAVDSISVQVAQGEV
ncbi:MAG: hypothetical protein JWO12_1145 [Frankiales bacterium]|nr:hypothetical protein [Frankiales bacterium]